MQQFEYRSVYEPLLDELPELRRPYERLVKDWDNFGGGPPGQYLIFSDTLGKLLQIALTLDLDSAGRDDLLRRALDFGERLLSAGGEIESLAIDCVAETLDCHPAGRAAVERFGGAKLKAWFAAYSRSDWERPEHDEIIDLWGVRGELVGCLPETPVQAIPGISHPADYLALESLDEARSAEDGTVLLSTFGTTRLYVVAPAYLVRASDADLDRAAKDLADIIGGEDVTGSPGARLRRIPAGERVWNMDIGNEKHMRRGDEAWIAGSLVECSDSIRAVLTGEQRRVVP